MKIKSLLLSLFVFTLVLSGCGTASPLEQDHTVNKKELTEEIIDNSQTEPKTTSAENLEAAKVLRVVDGDTVKVIYKGNEETVRLLLVDTPETKHPDLPIQPFGPEASSFAEETLTGKEIQLEFDGPERDKYDRLLSYIWVDGKNFNQLLIEEGLARYAYVYDPPYIHQDEMKAAEDSAKSNGRGIWSIQGYVTEDGFNHDIEVKEENKTDQEDIYYNNCTEAREAGVTPLYDGDPGYRTQMDGDDDGIACE
ncbi:thermonuclease family protein [Gracilibacillus xinjiangensis]|uniref:Thermonuclease family protein n=1 Tax=Gracilibacillus xinjiangensis TaxID=1193282 RepID=A0ABV8WXX4_9BACI